MKRAYLLIALCVAMLGIFLVLEKTILSTRAPVSLGTNNSDQTTPLTGVHQTSTVLTDRVQFLVCFLLVVAWFIGFSLLIPKAKHGRGGASHSSPVGPEVGRGTWRGPP